MKWTDQQQRAIELRDKNILVAAAAGSGKTAVLVERIKQLILKDRLGLDQFLIVTFTNAAAAEMKEKLLLAITKAIESEPENASFLRKQLDLAGSANISTFHSFALEVIRRYFYLTDIEPNFKIGDEGTIEIIKWDVLDQVFAGCFDKEEPEFLEFLRAYASDRGERTLKENMLYLYETIQSIPHPLEWLSIHVKSLNMDMEDLKQSDLMAFVRKDIEASVCQILDGFRQACELAEHAGLEGIGLKSREDLEALEPLEQLLRQGDYASMGKLLSSFKANAMRAGKAEKEEYEQIKDEMKALRDYSKKQMALLINRYFAQSMETYAEDLRSVYPAARCLERLILEFDQRFREAKRERNLIDFHDIEHYALMILEHEEAAREYRDKFACIFIDEYQDSNVMQETLMNQIRRENNLFMVGDVKQSIYKFRLAEPELFQAKYESYAREQDAQGTKIDLNRNFRSKGQVIASVNGIFREIMQGYDQEAALYQGVAYEGELDYRTQLHIVDSRITEDMDLDEEVAEMKNAQLEAYKAAEIIKTLLGNPIYDAKMGCERAVTKRDIVILMRATKNYADIFQEVFTELDIPSYADNSGGYFDTVEIQVFLNLLKVIDNKRQDLALLSALRSAVFGFSVEELICIRLQNRDKSYFEALLACSLECADAQLREKCAGVFEKLAYFRQMVQALPLSESVWKLMWETGYYTYCGALPAGQQRQANLRVLADKARDFQEMGQGGIYGFLVYIQALEKRQVPTGQATLINENDDIVRIMTIHKSKGLEFPIVLVAGLGKKFHITKSGKGFAAHKDLGLGLTRVESKEHWHRKTLVQTAVERKLRQEELEEQIRILYVAFTRAMDRLILLGTSKSVKDGRVQVSLSKTCFLDYLVPLAEECGMEVFLHDRRQLGVENLQRSKNRKKTEDLFQSQLTGEEDEILAEINRRLTFRYRNQQALSKKSKYSVTELAMADKSCKEPEQLLKTPLFTQGIKTFTAAQRGTIMHKVMECIDFKETLKSIKEGRGEAYVRGQVERMKNQELLFPEEAEAVDWKKIMAFFQTDIGARAARADVLYKEAEFNLLKEMEGTQVMVQGVVDCYFEEDDHLILIDYKNSYVNKTNREESLETLRRTYEGQVRIYREALEAIRGKPVTEAYLYLFSENDSLRV